MTPPTGKSDVRGCRCHPNSMLVEAFTRASIPHHTRTTQHSGTTTTTTPPERRFHHIPMRCAAESPLLCPLPLPPLVALPGTMWSAYVCTSTSTLPQLPDTTTAHPHHHTHARHSRSRSSVPVVALLCPHAGRAQTACRVPPLTMPHRSLAASTPEPFPIAASSWKPH
jgi:hypothetical protein